MFSKDVYYRFVKTHQQERVTKDILFWIQLIAEIVDFKKIVCLFIWDLSNNLKKKIQ